MTARFKSTPERLPLMLWRPRSILQLVLLGFFIVVAPLLLAIVFSLQTLNQQTSDAEQMTRELVFMIRQSQRLQGNLLDLERLARQYATLGDNSLLPLFRKTAEQSHSELTQLKALIPPQQSLIQILMQQLQIIVQGVPMMETSQPASHKVLSGFDTISQNNRQLQRAVTLFVDNQLNKQSGQADQLKASLRNQVLLLALLTLITALLFIYWISAPIQQLEKKIRALGHSSEDSTIQISGPLEMRALGQQLDWLRDQLNELETQKRQFLHHMSHELKTPLASLREGADLLHEGVVGELDDSQREIVSIIQQNSWELQRLIENLLDFNQALEHASITRHSVELKPLCQELLEPYRMLINRRELNVNLHGDTTSHCFDVLKTKAALDNLISNALNYCDSPGDILIRWQASEQGLSIDVANSGVTIPEQEADQIFTPFFQGSASRGGAIKGSGIGLSVARECIQAQGGELSLYPQDGWSTCFRIDLPSMECDA